jgi:hypothetical protein
MIHKDFQSSPALPRLVIAPNRRFLATEDGRPFFWLADTAWWLFRLPPPQLDEYLDQRARQGFNLIQVHCGVSRPDYAGNLPFEQSDPSRPNEAFWRTIDQIVIQAQVRRMYVALVPMWGDEYAKAFGGNAGAAEAFGYWVGSRYTAQTHILWIASGEYDAINNFVLPITPDQKRMLNAAAEGLRRAHQGRQLMTIHPGVARASSLDFHAAEWLDFNMLQSGHMNDSNAYQLPENHELVAADTARLPTKPVLDGEPFYEDTPDGIWVHRSILGPRADAAAMRRKAYWAVFAGACGHTYGHNNVFSFFVSAYPGQVVDLPEGPGQRGDWRASLQAEGAFQMKHLRALIESRSYFDRIPDDLLVTSDPGTGLARIKATRNESGTWALLYLPFGQPVSLDFNRLASRNMKAAWFNPRLGSIQPDSAQRAAGDDVFTPPTTGEDWVLTLDLV